MGPDPVLQLSRDSLYCGQGKAGPGTPCGFVSSEGSVPGLVSLQGCSPGLGSMAVLVTLTRAPRESWFQTYFTAVLLCLGVSPLEGRTSCLPSITPVAGAGLATGFCSLFPLPLWDGSREEPDIPACPRHE